MQRSAWKYVFVAAFFLILGMETMMSASGAYQLGLADISEEQEQIEDRLQNVASEEFHSLVIGTFSSVRQVETFKLGGSEQERDFVRIVRVTPRVLAVPSARNVVNNNFMHLLTERHYQGFYVYSLRKLII